MSEAGIEVDVIVQNAAADGTNDITFTVKRGESERAKSILDNIASSSKRERWIWIPRSAKSLWWV